MLFHCFQVKEEIFNNKDSGKEFGTVNWSMNFLYSSNAKKGPHSNYNAYKDFSDKELDSQICTMAMEYFNMDFFSGKWYSKISS